MAVVPLTTDEEHEVSSLCEAIGRRQLECKGYSGAFIQDIALADVYKLSIQLAELLSRGAVQLKEKT